eukprot:364509-Chlamydomonas_euryale.AAC.3
MRLGIQRDDLQGQGGTGATPLGDVTLHTCGAKTCGAKTCVGKPLLRDKASLPGVTSPAWGCRSSACWSCSNACAACRRRCGGVEVNPPQWPARQRRAPCRVLSADRRLPMGQRKNTPTRDNTRKQLGGGGHTHSSIQDASVGSDRQRTAAAARSGGHRATAVAGSGGHRATAMARSSKH